MNPTSNDSATDAPLSSAYSEAYFDALYHDNADPWQYQTRWYEERKRNTCLALLPKPHYTSAIELGCGNGVLSELLAQRCQQLVSVDGNQQAVQLAQKRLAALPHVKVIQGIIPDMLSSLTAVCSHHDSVTQYTSGSQPCFDLIVISEVLYYLSPSDVDIVIEWAMRHLAPNGTLLCCHWRYAIEGFALTGETVHKRLHHAFSTYTAPQSSAFIHQSQMIDSDFLLDIWQQSTDSIATQEHLV